MTGSKDGSQPGDPEPTTSGGAPPDGTVTPPPVPVEVQMMMLTMKHQQEAHDAAMQKQDLQSHLLAEQITALRAKTEKAREDKV
ncbi:hypothetical protein CYMTET_52373 [Cymbomonas tetramitiformis]|uniref:Uncharacterized protein n=1 Tax=Cymbomonas tetramitiformis TaxID=36881 RepID=A0AAE0BKF6_9CHLO|nr:hypothetical protein CYMTET_52373 [Cymbomonas tetramitiformis]